MFDEALSHDLKQLILELEQLDIKPFLWAGTLLGAVREGTFIKHDDDVDIAYISKYENPNDVMKEAVDLYKALHEKGLLLDYYDISWNKGDLNNIQTAFGQCHITINKEHPRDYTADLFTMWTRDGKFFDPWFGHIGNSEDFVYENDSCELDGVKFPGLEKSESIFLVLYGENWKTPIKGEKGTNRNTFRHALKEDKGGLYKDNFIKNNMYNKWEDVKEEDTNRYIACLSGEETFKVSGLIDAGLLTKTIRSFMEYGFLGKDILEFGCGSGRMTQYIREFFGNYFVADISDVMLGLTSKKTNVKCLKTDGSKIPLKQKSVDIVFTFTVLMHNKKGDVPAIISEFKRVLRTGGYLFMQLPCYTDKNEGKKFNDVSIWNKEEILELMNGWEVIDIVDSNRPMGGQISPEHFQYHVFRVVK